MKISIAMATYNGAAWISEQLASFLSQTRLPDELVITDDRSTDATIDIARRFGETAPFTVRVEVNPGKLGVRGNFDRAMSLCTGDIVLLCDQDDVWLDAKIARLEALLLSTPDKACVMNDAILTDGALVSAGRTKLTALRAAGLPDEDFNMGCCVGLRRDLLDLALPVPETAPKHDSWVVGVSDALGQTLRVAEPLQYYRRHGGNDSNFFVSAVEAPGVLEQLVRRAKDLGRRVSSTTGAARELYFVETIGQRLAERRDAATALVGGLRLAEIERSLAHRALVLRRREAIRAMAGMGRANAAAALWREGGYRTSGGLAGMIKDVVAAAAPAGGR